MEIAVNRKASFNYQLEDTYVAGLVLEGWEAKSLQKKKAQIDQAYVKIMNGEIYLFGATISPVDTTLSYTKPDALQDRKLLLNKHEINKIIGAVVRDGYTLVPLKIVKDRKFKLVFALAKGKKQHDKRQDLKEKDWQREQGQLMRKANKKFD